MSAPLTLPRLWNVRVGRHSQVSLAQAAGVSPYCVRKAENGKPIDRASAESIAAALNVRLAAIAGWDGRTTAVPNLEFGAAARRRDAVVHRVARAELVWRDGQVDRLEARWVCGDVAKWAKLLESPGDVRRCRKCDFVPTTAKRVVYAVTTADGLLKVGSTGHLGERIYGLERLYGQQVTLIDSVAGGYSDELELLHLLGEPVRGREWFEPTAERLALVAGWMSERAS